MKCCDVNDTNRISVYAKNNYNQPPVPPHMSEIYRSCDFPNSQKMLVFVTHTKVNLDVGKNTQNLLKRCGLLQGGALKVLIMTTIILRLKTSKSSAVAPHAEFQPSVVDFFPNV
jgi:hypothetical protein